MENLREVNLRMIRNMKKLELGIKSRDEEAREVMLERLRKEHGGDQSWTVSDLVMSAALLLFAGTGYFAYKVPCGPSTFNTPLFPMLLQHHLPVALVYRNLSRTFHSSLARPRS